MAMVNQLVCLPMWFLLSGLKPLHDVTPWPINHVVAAVYNVLLAVTRLINTAFSLTVASLCCLSIIYAKDEHYKVIDGKVKRCQDCFGMDFNRFEYIGFTLNLNGLIKQVNSQLAKVFKGIHRGLDQCFWLFCRNNLLQVLSVLILFPLVIVNAFSQSASRKLTYKRVEIKPRRSLVFGSKINPYKSKMMNQVLQLDNGREIPYTKGFKRGILCYNSVDSF